MTPTLRTALLLAALLSPLAAGSAATGAPLRPESRLWITGASTLRAFTCRASELRGTLDLLPGTTAAGVLRGEDPAGEAELSIPVDALDCGIGAMNRHLRETLRADVSPTIRFHLCSYDLGADPAAATVRLEGTLAIAGVERPVRLVGRVSRDAGGAVHLAGSREIDVTEFGVRPPRRFLGALRVRETVTVHYDVVLP